MHRRYCPVPHVGRFRGAVPSCSRAYLRLQSHPYTSKDRLRCESHRAQSRILPGMDIGRRGGQTISLRWVAMRSGRVTRGLNCQAGPRAFRTAQSSSVWAELSDDPVQAGGPGGRTELAHSHPSMYRLPPRSAGQPPPTVTQPSCQRSYKKKSTRYVPTMPDSNTSYDPYAPPDFAHPNPLTTPRIVHQTSLTAPPSLLRSTGFFDNLVPLLFPVLSSLYNFLSVVGVVTESKLLTP